LSDDETLGFEDSEHPPFFRATYADGRLSMVVRPPWLPSPDQSGWAAPFFERPETDTVIADLTIIRSGGSLELVVDELVHAEREDFRMMLTRWATLLGYRRIWVGLEIIELSDEPVSWDTRVTTTCFGCCTKWRADQMGFWINARNAGVFPNACALCGALMPVFEQDVSARDADHRSVTQ
jgi:hypothetical protein